jgi:hypothetical protein
MEAIKDTMAAFAESSVLSYATLLRLIDKWRRLQSGASDKKVPGYSSEG